MISIRLLLLVMASGAGAALPALAAPELDALFQDHAVLQRDKPVPVWGRATPGEHVSASYGGQTLGATTGPDGRWIVVFAPMAANPSGADLTVSGIGKAVARDVVVGEIWLCSGGSNMEFEVDDARRPMFRVNDAEAEAAAARHPLIRHFKVAPQSSARPMETLQGDWKVCSPETVGRFTAVGYFFARDLLARLNVPFGIINSTLGEAPLESWMSPVALGGLPGLSSVRPAADGPLAPGSAFNGMIHPLLQYAIRGAIWYQGEGDVGRAAGYAIQFPRMMTSWRAH